MPMPPTGQFGVLPKETDVVVIGGGIIGACTALSLARRKIPVVLCEKGIIGEEQSNRNWGWVRKMGRDPREVPLMIRAQEIWSELSSLIGADVGFRENGITYFCDHERDLEKYDNWLKAVSQYGLDSRLLTRVEAGELAPGATRKFHGGIHTASDGSAEPHLAAAAIAHGAERLGAQIITCCAVRGFETKGGRISEAVTEKGRIRCNNVVLAGGAWSSLFGRNQGIKIPQLKVVSQVARTNPIFGAPPGCGMGDGFAYRKRLDGGYNVSMKSALAVDIVPDSFRYFVDFLPGLRHEWRAMRFRIGKRSIRETFMPSRWSLDQHTPFEKFRVLQPEPSDAALDQSIRNIKKLFPVFNDLVVNERIGGLIDVTPDGLPIISRVDATPGLYISTGYSGHGFGIAPAAGQLMSELIMGDKPVVDPTPFRHSRFVDGSKIIHWPIGF